MQRSQPRCSRPRRQASLSCAARKRVSNLNCSKLLASRSPEQSADRGEPFSAVTPRPGGAAGSDLALFQPLDLRTTPDGGTSRHFLALLPAAPPPGQQRVSSSAAHQA